MERGRFEALVARLQADAKRRPRLYRLRVTLFALLGYAYVLLILAGVLAATALVLWLIVSGTLNYLVLKLAVPLLVLSGVILRAMWVRIPAPEGRALRREEAPRLFALVDDLRRAAGAPAFNAVLATPEFNAAVSEIPRLGLLGFPRHYLVVGLPLLASITPTQLRAVLAHELGHRSGRHGRLGGWIYRVRQTWMQLLAAFEERGRKAMGLLTRFVSWYAPRLEAYSFVLAREREYEADRLAAELTSPRDVGETLTAIEVRERFHRQELWPAVQQRVALEPEPPMHALRTVSESLPRGPDPDGAARYLREALARRTDSLDTHPSLADRLAALGVAPQVPGSVLEHAETAAHALLGDLHWQLLDEADERWRQAVGTAWRDSHRLFAKDRAQLEALGAAAARGTLAPVEQAERAVLVARLQGPRDALPLLAEAAEAQPDHAGLRFTLGQALLDCGDARGLDVLDEAIGMAPRLTIPACDLQAAFLGLRGDEERLAQVRRRRAEEEELLERARTERQGVSASDAVEPHGIPAEALQVLRRQLEGHDDVRRAWMARKTVRWLPEEPYLVFVAEVTVPFPTFDKKKVLGETVHRLATQLGLPDGTWVIATADRRHGVLKNIRATGREALVYDRSA